MNYIWEKVDERHAGSPDPRQDRRVRARRRGLILVRGICAVLTILLATMTVLALIDYLFLLPDMARYTMSAVGYGVAILGAWWTCARLVWRSSTRANWPA